MAAHLLALPLLLAASAQLPARPPGGGVPGEPLHLAYLFELAGTPVGTLELSIDGDRYTYRSRQLFTREDDVTERARRAQFTLDASGRVAGRNVVPDTLALVRRPTRTGCIETLDELTGKERQVCFTHLEGQRARGTAAGIEFVAQYAGERLTTLELGPARFRLHEGPVHLAERDVLSDGVPVRGAGPRLALEPPRSFTCRGPGRTWSKKDATRLARQVHGAFASKKPSSADFDAVSTREQPSAGCLGHVKRFVRLAGPSRAVAVFGLLTEPGAARAAPHAWVRVSTPSGPLDLDPTSLEPVTSETHLPLACSSGEDDSEPGRMWLDVLFGNASVVRTP